MSSTPFPNRYVHRTATKEQQCFVCGKFSTAVLTSNADADWFYVCLGHLTDKSFAAAAAAVVTPSTAATASRPAGSTTTAPAASKTDGKESKDKEEASTKPDGKDQTSATSTASGTQAPQPQPQPQPPREFTLDSKIFFLREDAYRKKMAARKAKQVSNAMPSVPRTGF